ncbi:MAG: class II glutamine amidotransferase, partial [Bacteroidota bacterium]|nr:class II glutamine amidotransferase [Bacteroidota bacterium]
MCGIVGYVGQQEAKDLLLEGLKKLEYRGYDSAGIAILNGDIHLFKSPGNIASLESTLPSTIEGKCGIAHTRWATHGAPNQTNAHPHVSNSGDMTMVHNGIIENYQELKKELRDKGYSFKSDTDSEVLLNLIEFEYNQNGQDAADAIRKATSRVKGTYAIGLLIKGESDKIYAIRCGSPLIIAKAQEGFYMASDLNAFSTTTDEVFFPEDHDLIILNTQEGIRTINAKGNEIRMISETFQAATNSTGKNGFEDYMLKEIFEQEETVPLAMVYSG